MKSDRQLQLDAILRIAADLLDLAPTQYKDAVSKYEAVGDWLSRPASILHDYDPIVFAQGSIAIGTCVRPVGQDEFDIDLVLQMALPSGMSQREIKALVGRRLGESGFYRDRLEEKNRCWRINYAGEFHLDVLPAKPDQIQLSPTALLVPDKALSTWKETNPKGYAKWFACEKAKSLYEAAAGRIWADVEPAPAPITPRNKTPLQLAVQLLKRHRDLQFEGHKDAPISIIITTLAGHAYQGQQDVYETIKHLLTHMPLFIQRDQLGRPYVLNPTNECENFCGKWHSEPNKERAFHRWIAQAQKDLDDVAASALSTITEPLARFVGIAHANRALRQYGETLHAARGKSLTMEPETGLLNVAPLVVAAKNITVPRNTFYGGPDKS